jgi:hypothetical protein
MSSCEVFSDADDKVLPVHGGAFAAQGSHRLYVASRTPVDANLSVDMHACYL